MPFFGLIDLPKDPLPAIRVLLAYYRKTEPVETVEVGHAALHLACYGYGFIDPHEPPMYGMISQSEFIDALAALESGMARAIPWQLLVGFALEILKKLLLENA